MSNGLSVRAVYDISHAMQANLFEPYNLADVSAVLMQVNGAFAGGFVDQFADEHLALPVTTVPEPSDLALMLTGVALCG
jgi:hypothetical protein